MCSAIFLSFQVHVFCVYWSHYTSSTPDVQHPQLWRNLGSVIRREVKAAHVYGMAVMYLYVTPRQMSRCFITLSVHCRDYNNPWIWK